MDSIKTLCHSTTSGESTFPRIPITYKGLASVSNLFIKKTVILIFQATLPFGHIFTASYLSS